MSYGEKCQGRSVTLKKYFFVGFLLIILLQGCLEEKAGVADLNQPIEEKIKDEIPVKEPCPFDCCEDQDFLEKTCSSNKICVDNKCELKDCPYACCVDGKYKTETCDLNYKCEENECISLRHEKTYYENIPKEVEVAYTEEICEQIPYTEEYQEEECHDEDFSYSKSEISTNGFFNLSQGCVFSSSIDVTNNELDKPGEFIIDFNFSPSEGESKIETTKITVNESSKKTVTSAYDKGCFEADPSISIEVKPPKKQVCLMVTKSREKTREECHDETMNRTETIYEKVEKTKIVCEDYNICEELDCDDHEECTDDYCNEDGCYSTTKQEGSLCAAGTCQNGKCVKQTPEQTCNYENCDSRSGTDCSGTTKITTTYYCESNGCKTSVIQETDSTECGYSSAPTELNTKQKVEALFGKFTEFNKLENGATVNLYLIDETTDFTITKTSLGVQVVENDEGSITLALDIYIFEQLYEAENVCDKLKYFTSEDLISEMNFIKNKNDPELLAEGFNNLLNCFQ